MLLSHALTIANVQKITLVAARKTIAPMLQQLIAAVLWLMPLVAAHLVALEDIIAPMKIDAKDVPFQRSSLKNFSLIKNNNIFNIQLYLF